MNLPLKPSVDHAPKAAEPAVAGPVACDDAGCAHTGGCPRGATAATCPMNRLGIGCRGSVVSVGGDRDLRRRLLEMGFCRGTTVEVVRRSPFGDPIEFLLRGYHLSLRGEQAKFVQVAVV